MKLVQVSSAIGGTIHEGSIILGVFILVPFCVGCKESVFIDVFANARSTQLRLECKSDWNLVLSHPLIVQASKVISGSCRSEDTFMTNFKNTGAAKLLAKGLVCGVEQSCGRAFYHVCDKGLLEDRVITEQKAKAGIIRCFQFVLVTMQGGNKGTMSKLK